ncbi:MAG: HD-GYP domain-containing protein [Vicinamibacterales bacterium]
MTPLVDDAIPRLNPNPVLLIVDGRVGFANEAAATIQGIGGLVEHLNSALHGTAASSVAIAWNDRAYLAHCVRHENGWACFLTDVTELRDAERRASHLASFPELNPSPVVELDEQGACIYTNPAARADVPSLAALGSAHPLLAWLTEPDSAAALGVTREVPFQERWFLVASSRLPSLRRYRVYLIDITAARAAELSLSRSRVELIQRLAQAAEWRDNETGAHIKRMSAYCRVVAEELGFRPGEADQLELAATMHDVGKIAIPDAILHKPDRLTPDEYLTMQGHTVVGSALLQGSDDPLLTMARDVARCHHEKWDGTGYPDKLAGTAIPLVARIAAVCDVFDALTSVRPYKKAWSNEEAFKEIRRLSGQHFDPAVAEAFCRRFNDILSRQGRWSDAITAA